MSSLTFLSVYLSGVSLIDCWSFLLHLYPRAAVCINVSVCSASEYDDFTPAPDYNSDYNATFEYSFYSNTSLEDLDEFSERFIDQEEGDMTITMVTTQGPAMDGGADDHNGASLPVCLETRMLLWTLMILIEQLLQHTL